MFYLFRASFFSWKSIIITRYYKKTRVIYLFIWFRLIFPEKRIDVSEDLKNLIRKMLHKDPKYRSTIQDIISDKWIN